MSAAIRTSVRLFEQFPSLSSAFAHVDLGVAQTPVERVRVGYASLLIKRDDLAASPLGGNKVRALEFLLAAVKPGDTVLTVGSRGSTHALATAIYAQLLGATCEVITWPQEEHAVSRQVARRLSEVAHVTHATSPIDAFVRAYTRRLRRRVHWIPAGASTPRGALGHVSAALELIAQLREQHLTPTHIVAPLGSGGTIAGLVAGLSIAERPMAIHAVRVVPFIIGNRGHVLRLAWQTYRLIKRHAREHIGRFEPAMLHLDHHEYGGAYARETATARIAADALLAAGGPRLDPTYSAKAFHPALHRAQGSPDGEVLFWLTFDARWLPR